MDRSPCSFAFFFSCIALLACVSFSPAVVVSLLGVLLFFPLFSFYFLPFIRRFFWLGIIFLGRSFRCPNLLHCFLHLTFKFFSLPNLFCCLRLAQTFQVFFANLLFFDLSLFSLPFIKVFNCFFCIG
jgi:hypothetical protein